MFFVCSDWLLNLELSAVFTASPPVPLSKQRQTCVSKMASRFAAVTKKEISQIIKQAVLKIHEESDISRFDLNLSMKPVKKFFVCKCKLSLSLAFLYLAELFINKLKTKFNSFFYNEV